MKILVFGVNYNPSDSLISITEKKCAKLERRFKDNPDAEIKFTVTLENGDYTTNVVLTDRDVVYRVDNVSGSPFDNVDAVIPKLLGQMEKQKDIEEKQR